MKADRTRLNVLLIGACIMGVMAVTTSVARAQISFEPLREFRAGEFPFAITGGDFDGDGDIDVVVSEQLGGLNLLLGDGEGNFEPPIKLPGPGGARLASVDIDNDGDLDVLGTFQGTEKLIVVENDGTGFFAVKSKIPVGTESPVGVTSGDFDGDGDMDAAVITADGVVSIFVNDGGGELRPVDLVLAALPGQNFFGNLVAADMDGDGDLDLVAGCNTNPEIVMLRNERDDSKKAEQLGVTFRFRAAQFGFTPNVQFGARNLDVGDLDGDGDLDTFSVNGAFDQPYQSQVALNNGSGKLTLGWVFPNAVLAENVKLVDMDLDGDLDAVIADHGVAPTLDGINVFVNDGSATFTIAGSGWATSSGLNSSPFDLLIADLDDDGDMDVVAPNTLHDTIGVLLNSTL